MEAVVLAGGLGTRLRAVVPDLPKPMAPVAGRPFLELLLLRLAAKGFTRVILSIGYMADRISRHFGTSFAGMDIDYSVETEPLGTGGAVRLACTKVRSDHLFIFNGDTYLDLDVAVCERLWQDRHRPVIVARQVEDTARYGRLDIANDRVIGFAEKGMSGPGLINAGCYILGSEQLQEFGPGSRFSLETDFLAGLVRRTPVVLHVAHGMFIDIGIPEDYARAQTMLAGQV